MSDSSVCHSGSAHRPSPPIALPHLFFLYSYYHTCYRLIYLCVHFFSVSPQNVSPGAEILSTLLLRFSNLENSIWNLVDLQCLLLGLTAGVALPASPHCCQKYIPFIICSFHFFPSEMHNLPSPNPKPQSQMVSKTT